MQKFWFVMVVQLLFLLAGAGVQAVQNADHPSVKAALACIDQIGTIIKNRQPQGKDVQCTIPVTLSEQDLDEIFKAALRKRKMSEKMRGRAEKYSSLFTKTLTNFRAATCEIKLHVSRRQIIKALASENILVQLPDQPADCQVTTRKREIKRLKFAFSPRVKMARGCVSDFSLNMGKIEVDCRVCYLNRLFLSTKLVSVWANSMGDNVKQALNFQLLDKRCR